MTTAYIYRICPVVKSTIGCGELVLQFEYVNEDDQLAKGCITPRALFQLVEAMQDAQDGFLHKMRERITPTHSEMTYPWA